MNHNWRADWHAGKRRKHHPLRAWMPILAALASMLAICTYCYIEVWAPLQRFYLTTYILTGLRSVGGMANSGHYELLAVTTKNGSHWASDGEVTEARTESGGTTVALTQEALKNGGLHLVLVTVQFDDGKLHDFLRQDIYRDQSLAVFLRPALWGGLVVLFVWPTFTLLKEAVAANRKSRGRRLSTPGLASSQVLTHQNRLDPTYENSPFGAPTNHGVFREARPSKVEPHEPRTVVRTTVSVDDDARRKIRQDEINPEPEQKLNRKPARKERYFQ